MRICKKCNKPYKLLVIIDGKERNLGSRKFCLECSPFGSHNTGNLKVIRPAKIDSLSKEEFSQLIKSCNSRSEIFDKLKMRKSGASYQILNRRINNDGVDISHFKLGWAFAKHKKYTNDEVFTISDKNIEYRVRTRVIKEKLIEYKCKICGIGDCWNWKKLTLELDHINGNRFDNRLINLRFLCPNCHSQTETFGTKKRTGQQHKSRAGLLQSQG